MKSTTETAKMPNGAGENGFVAGMSPAMQSLESVISEIARTDIPVLLTGESGTGKAILAYRLHHLSSRHEEPVLRVACASMDPGSFAAELGLHAERGFDSGWPPGTVVLDEISELEATCQRKLLYALPDGTTSSRHRFLTARVVSTTSRNLKDEIRAGRFRSELYYRINGVGLRVPALRERREDIPLLVEFFLTKHSAQLKRPRPSLSPRILRLFLDHSWPGNIRELENSVKKIVALGDEQLVAEELQAPACVRQSADASESHTCSLKAAARAASREAERNLIMEALARTHWNRKRAAQELQISYKSLLYKLKQVGGEESKQG